MNLRWKSDLFSSEKGAANPFLIGMISFAVLAVGAAGAFFWAFTQMQDYRNNVDDKVAVAVEEAKVQQKEELQKQFNEDYKRPNLTFRSSSDFGSVTFEYPRTWSQYIAKDTDSLEIYFHPVAVPTVNSRTPFALRVTVTERAYDQVLRSFESKIKSGELSASTLTIGRTDSFSGYEGMRINGQFAPTINGSVVVFKIRDKTLQVFVDSQDFMKDFNDTVLPSLTFEP